MPLAYAIHHRKQILSKAPKCQRIDPEGYDSYLMLIFLPTEGAVSVRLQIPSWVAMEKEFHTLLPGGRSRPLECQARTRVAVIIPYRDRDVHLKMFLNNIHPFLQRQQLDYGIFVVELV